MYPVWKRVAWDILRKAVMFIVLAVMGWLGFKWPPLRQVLELIANAMGMGQAYILIAEHFGEFVQVWTVILTLIGLIFGSAVGKSLRGRVDAEGNPKPVSWWAKLIGG